MTPTGGGTISAAMIVRNEAHHLYDCIASLKGQVDEVLLVDTGSTDGTLNLEWLGMLTPPPITLATFPWCDDFSAARNDAIGYCQGDWVFIVDADDRLEGGLRALTENAPADVIAYSVNTISRWPSGQQTLSADHCRLWRNRRGIQYQRRVHELPYMPDGSDVAMTPQDSVTLRHIGYESYQDNALNLNTKRERNRRLVLLGLEDEPHNPRYWFDYARVALGDGLPSTALSRLHLALEWWHWEDCPPREFVGPALDLALEAARAIGDTAGGTACWNLVPVEYRTAQSATLFGRLLTAA